METVTSRELQSRLLGTEPCNLRVPGHQLHRIAQTRDQFLLFYPRTDSPANPLNQAYTLTFANGNWTLSLPPHLRSTPGPLKVGPMHDIAEYLKNQHEEDSQSLYALWHLRFDSEPKVLNSDATMDTLYRELGLNIFMAVLGLCSIWRDKPATPPF